MLNFISFGLSLVITIVLFPVSRKLAKKVGLIDDPAKERKVHKKPTPLIGGLLVGTSLLISFLLVSIVEQTFDPFFLIVIGIFVLYMVLGAIDDRFDIPAKQKFLIQIFCAFLVVNSGVYLQSLNVIFDLELPIWFLQSFTVLIIVAGVNAYNLIDGIDGLLGSFLTFGFLWLLIVSNQLENNQMNWLFLSAIGSLVVFLKRNFTRKKKIFMGDSGSLSLGFLLIVCSIYLFEESNMLERKMNWMSMGILAFLMLPFTDTLIVFTRRINKGVSPFKADKTHLHHQVLNLNFSHKNATALIVGLALFLFFNSMALFELGLYVLALLLTPFCIILFYVLLLRMKAFRKRQQVILSIEKSTKVVG